MTHTDQTRRPDPMHDGIRAQYLRSAAAEVASLGRLMALAPGAPAHEVKLHCPEWDETAAELSALAAKILARASALEGR